MAKIQTSWVVAGAAVLLMSGSAMGFEIQGHRGARGLLPENTLPAFQAAIDFGVDTLELDVGVTADNVVVVSHNRRLAADMARGADGKWISDPAPLIRQLTYDQISTYDVGRAKPASGTARRFPEQQPVDGTPMPKLAQVLALGATSQNGALKFNIETKLSPLAPDDTIAPQAFVEALLATVGDAGMQDRVSIQSFDWRTLAIAKRLAPNIPTVCLTAEQPWLNTLQLGAPGASPWLAGIDVDELTGSPAKAAKAAGCTVWSPFAGDVTPARVAEAHDLGLQVVVWTVNKPADMTRLKTMGVDGLITDYPDRAAKLFGRTPRAKN